jgi:putative DNA primase/helicase
MTVHDPHLAQTTESGRTIVEALGGRWSPRGGMCRCPAHADRSPSLSVRPGRSRLLFHCFAGCHTDDVLRALGRLNLPAAAMIASPLHSAPHRARGSAAAAQIWSQARPLAGTIAERYLQGRAVPGSNELRFHPRTPQGRAPLTRFAPAMIAAVRDEAGLVAVHRTFLASHGRGLATRQPSRAALGLLGSGLVRLAPASNVLGLAEGIETALSASALFGLPCWATLGTERFQRIALPASIHRIILFLDNDAAGRRAEVLARAHFQHLPVLEARYPERPGEDWNDVVRRVRPPS